MQNCLKYIIQQCGDKISIWAKKEREMFMNNLKKKYIDGKEGCYVAFIFVLFLIALVIQHSFVGLCFDDYGNGSLSYGYEVAGVDGTNFSLRDLCKWAKEIYFNWGGRLLYACLFLIPMLKDGIDLFMFVQAFVITALFYLMYRIVCDHVKVKHSIGIALLMPILYGLIGIQIHAYTTYWASASVLYIWPMVPMLFAMLYYDRTCRKIASNEPVSFFKFAVIEGICVTFTTLAQEQLGGGLLVNLVLYIILHHWKDLKKYLKIDVYTLVVAVVTYLVLFLAPGNYARMGENTEFSNLPFLGKIQTNLPRIHQMINLSDFRVFHKMLILVSICMVVILLVKEWKNIWNIITAFVAVVTSAIALYGMPSTDNNVTTVTYLVFYIGLAFVSFRYYWVKGKKEFICYLVAAVAMNYCLLISPALEVRSFVPYLLITFLHIGIVFQDVWMTFGKYKIAAGMMVLYLATLVNSGTSSFMLTLNGYYENEFYTEYNHLQLKNWKNEKSNIIVLLNYPNSLYRGTTTCDHTMYDEKIDHLMKQYYGIDEDVLIKWTDVDSYRNTNLLINYNHGFYGKEGFGKDAYRWSADTCSMVLTNTSDDVINVTFHADILCGNDKEASLDILYGDETYSYQITSKNTQIEMELELQPGDNQINFQTDAKQVDAPGDERTLFLRWYGIKVY